MSEPNIHITVAAGYHDRFDCPVPFQVPSPLPDVLWELTTENGAKLPAQRLEGDRFVYVEPCLRAGESRTYRLSPNVKVNELIDDAERKGKRELAEGFREGYCNVTLTHEEGEQITIARCESLLTRYVYGHVPARPYFYPLLAPNEVPITRAYPMRPDDPMETKDHHHHRSVWIAHGEVNGTDNWSEESGHGHTEHQSVDLLESGPVVGRFGTTSLWTTVDHAPLLTERLQVCAWATSESVRLMDFTIQLEATHGDVLFGDTKEGGILSVRVASSLDVPRGGRIENSFGGINEGEAWGKAAHWCDYSGIVGGQPIGIAILDHPLSFRYPTHWHVRDYGLMTANPFGYSHFTGGVKEGSHQLPAGQSLRFRYRVVLHTGDATAGRIQARYLDFMAPPKATVG